MNKPDTFPSKPDTFESKKINTVVEEKFLYELTICGDKYYGVTFKEKDRTCIRVANIFSYFSDGYSDFNLSDLENDNKIKLTKLFKVWYFKK